MCRPGLRSSSLVRTPGYLTVRDADRGAARASGRGVPTASPPGQRAGPGSALLEAAARGLSRHGYSDLVLERVASEAGYTRGALYHLFASKEELALAVLAWVDETWWAEVGHLLPGGADPVGVLTAGGPAPP